MIYVNIHILRDPSPEEAKLIGANEEIMTIRRSILDRL